MSAWRVPTFAWNTHLRGWCWEERDWGLWRDANSRAYGTIHLPYICHTIHVYLEGCKIIKTIRDNRRSRCSNLEPIEFLSDGSMVLVRATGPGITEFPDGARFQLNFNSNMKWVKLVKGCEIIPGSPWCFHHDIHWCSFTGTELDFALDVCNGVVEVPGSPSKEGLGLSGPQDGMESWKAGKLERWKGGKVERLLHPQSSILK